MAVAGAAGAANVPPLDPANLDRTCAACADFSQFANGGWREHHPISPASPTRGPFDILVNGTIENMPEFARAFACKRGDAMVKPAAARCEIW